MLATKQTRYLKKSHKFCIQLPKTVEQSLALYNKNGKSLQAGAISKELENVRVVFKILPDGKNASIDHPFVQYHMVFSIKMKYLRHKARLVAVGYMTKA